MKQSHGLPPEAEEAQGEIREGFTATHEGYFLGFLPVYTNEEDGSIMGKNAFYDWMIPWTCAAWNCFCLLMSFFGQRNPGFPLKIKKLSIHN